MSSQPASPSWSDRFRYAFDALIARGAWALIVWHLLIALTAVVVVSLIAAALGLTPVDEAGERVGFLSWSGSR